MSETVTLEQDQWSSKPLSEAQQKNRDSAALIPFTEGGMSPQNFAQVVDFAKHMAQAKGMLGPHLVGNYAGCLAIIELAQQFRMRPFMLARQTYFVNGMIAFDGQAVMSIMNMHMPLAKTPEGKKTRLRYIFSGNRTEYGEPVEVDDIDERTNAPTGKKIWVSKIIKPSTRMVKVIGRMENEVDDLEYESPTVFNIKNKKSPLWVEDEDQQLIYWASRRWQRRHWPEGMLGIIDREEAMMMHIGADNAKLIEATPGAALLARIKAAQIQTDDADQLSTVREGFTADHAHTETNAHHVHENIADKSPPASDGPEPPASDNQQPDAGAPATASKKIAKGKKADKAEPAPEPEPEHEVMPRNPPEWKVYCEAWIATTKPAELNKRWKEEVKLRNDCGVTQEFRDPVYDQLLAKRDAG